MFLILNNRNDFCGQFPTHIGMLWTWACTCYSVLLCYPKTSAKIKVTLWMIIWPHHSPKYQSLCTRQQLMSDTFCCTFKSKVVWEFTEYRLQSYWLEVSASWEVFILFRALLCLKQACFWRLASWLSVPKWSVQVKIDKKFWWSWKLKMGWLLSVWHRSNF